MNPKIAKYKAERQKNAEKINALQARNKKLDELITKLENTDIIGMVRESGITLDALCELLGAPQTEPPPVETEFSMNTEVSDDEDEK